MTLYKGFTDYWVKSEYNDVLDAITSTERKLRFLRSNNASGGVDLNEAKSHVSIGLYLESCGVKPVYSCSKYSCYSAPYRSDSSPSLYWYKDKNRYWDFGMSEGGTIIDLIMKMEKLSTTDAISRLKSMI